MLGAREPVGHATLADEVGEEVDQRGDERGDGDTLGVLLGHGRGRAVGGEVVGRVDGCERDEVRRGGVDERVQMRLERLREGPDDRVQALRDA